MAEPTPGGAPVPPDDTEGGRAKHVAPTDGEAVDHPTVARAATGPDAARTAAPEEGRADRPAAAVPAAPSSPEAPVQDAAETRQEPVVETPATERPADRTPVPPAEEPAGRTRALPVEEPADRTRALPAEARADRTEVLPAEERADRTEVLPAEDRADRTEVLPAEDRADRTEVLPAEERADRTPPPPVPEQRAAPLPAADAPPPPRRGSNRLVGTAWVLLAALLFEVVYLVAFALLVLIVDGANAVGGSLQQIAATPFVWLPLVLFVLFYELTVLLLNRAGRFAYVLASLVVALIVYVLSTVLILAMQEGGIGNEVNLGRALIVPQVVLIPLVAREVMLWTGLAIGARGHRVRRRNRQAQEDYERERFARSARGADDGARTGA